MSRYLTNLADVVRRSGLTVHEVDGWKTRGHGPMDDDLTGIVCHHTAGPKTGDHPSLGVVTNGRADLKGPLSHLLLSRSGEVHVVAAGLCWHAGGVRHIRWTNRHMIGIEAEATGVDEWPAVQLEAYAKLCAELTRGYSLKVENVLGHKEVCDPPGRKIDPNFSMPDLRRRVTALREAPKPPPAPAPKPQYQQVITRYLKEGNTGNDVRSIQHEVGAHVDGVFGPKTKAAVQVFQGRHGRTRDGIVGPIFCRDAGLIWRG